MLRILKLIEEGKIKAELQAQSYGQAVSEVKINKGVQPLQGDTNVSSRSKLNTPESSIEQILGITVEEAIATWKKEGAPIIHLGPGENCERLDKLLNCSWINPKHLEAIKRWLSERRVEPGDLPWDF
jgi:hypothetical protein